MPTNLTGSSVSSTYDQLLHISDGPGAIEKTVHSGTGVATALKLGTGSASVDNIKFDGNTIASTDTNGDINLIPNGTGTVAFSKAAITGGTITGVSLSGLTGDLPIADGGTGASTAATARTNLGIGTNGTFDAAYGQFYSTQDQTPAANTPTILTLNNSSAFNTGVSVVSNSRVTYTTAGVYSISVRVQFNNTTVADHDAYLWLRKNGTDIPDLNSVVVVPKTGDGGHGIIEISYMQSVTAGQYIEAVVMVEDAGVDIKYTAASAGPPVVPSIPSVIYCTHRVA